MARTKEVLKVRVTLLPFFPRHRKYFWFWVVEFCFEVLTVCLTCYLTLLVFPDLQSPWGRGISSNMQCFRSIYFITSMSPKTPLKLGFPSYHEHKRKHKSCYFTVETALIQSQAHQYFSLFLSHFHRRKRAICLFCWWKPGLTIHLPNTKPQASERKWGHKWRWTSWPLLSSSLWDPLSPSSNLMIFWDKESGGVI